MMGLIMDEVMVLGMHVKGYTFTTPLYPWCIYSTIPAMLKHASVPNSKE
jgi:hypothetical protein